MSADRVALRMPYAAPSWLTLPRVTVVAIVWAPIACGLVVTVLRGGSSAYGFLLPFAACQAVAAWWSVRSLGPSFDRRGRAICVACVLQVVSTGLLTAILSDASGFATGPLDVLLGALIAAGLGGAILGPWAAMLLAIAATRPRAVALNAAERTLVVLGVAVAIPCACMAAMVWVLSRPAGVVALVAALVPALAAAGAAWRIHAWRRWLRGVEAGTDARWKLVAADDRVGMLYAARPAGGAFRDMDMLLPVALITRE